MKRESLCDLVAGANRRWHLQFRCRGSRHESAVAELFSLAMKRTLLVAAGLCWIIALECHSANGFAEAESEQNFGARWKKRADFHFFAFLSDECVQVLFAIRLPNVNLLSAKEKHSKEGRARSYTTLIRNCGDVAR